VALQTSRSTTSRKLSDSETIVIIAQLLTEIHTRDKLLTKIHIEDLSARKGHSFSSTQKFSTAKTITNM
jgi:hypothetical protein